MSGQGKDASTLREAAILNFRSPPIADIPRVRFGSDCDRFNLSNCGVLHRRDWCENPASAGRDALQAMLAIRGLPAYSESATGGFYTTLLFDQRHLPAVGRRASTIAE